MSREFFSYCTNSQLEKAVTFWSENKENIDLEFLYTGNTALTLSAFKGHTEVVKWLIEQGASLNAVTEPLKQTALIRAAARGHIEIVTALIEAGADSDITDKDGKSALDHAIRERKTDVVKLLDKSASEEAMPVPEPPQPEPTDSINITADFFEDFDFSDFWVDSDYALEEYVRPPPSDELIKQAEEKLGYKLPESYIWLMNRHNGGIPRNTCHPMTEKTSWSHNHIEITAIYAVDSLVEATDNAVGMWEYPDIGVVICDCPSAGHDYIFLDYRDCSKDGEPKVVHVDQEWDYKITIVADNFESFIRGLVNSDIFDEDDEVVETAEKIPPDIKIPSEMKNITCVELPKYKDGEKYQSMGSGIFKDLINKRYVVTLHFELIIGEEEVSYYPLEDILDKYLVNCADHYEQLENGPEIMWIEVEIEDSNDEDFNSLDKIKKVADLVGKRVYNREDEDGVALVIE